MKNRTHMFYVGLTGCALLLLSACSTPQIKGQWQPIASSGLYFSGVSLPKDAVDRHYPDTCMEAQHEISRQLTQQLQKKISPLHFYSKQPKDTADIAELSVTITKCSFDVDQTGDTFRFYLTLGTRLELKERGRSVMRHNMLTHENTTTSTPTPLFEFTFANPVRHTLQLFNGAQVLIPDPS